MGSHASSPPCPVFCQALLETYAVSDRINQLIFGTAGSPRQEGRASEREHNRCDIGSYAQSPSQVTVGLPAADQGGLFESGSGKNSGRSVASRIHAEVPSSRGLNQGFYREKWLNRKLHCPQAMNTADRETTTPEISRPPILRSNRSTTSYRELTVPVELPSRCRANGRDVRRG